MPATYGGWHFTLSPLSASCSDTGSHFTLSIRRLHSCVFSAFRFRLISSILRMVSGWISRHHWFSVIPPCSPTLLPSLHLQSCRYLWRRYSLIVRRPHSMIRHAPPKKSLQATRDGDLSSAIADDVTNPACLSC